MSKPFVNMLERQGLNHRFSVILVFVTAFGFILILTLFLYPAVSSELVSIQSRFDSYTNVLTEKFYRLKNDIFGFSGGFSSLFDENDIDETLRENIRNILISFIQSAPLFIMNAIPLILYLVVIPFATFFFLLDGEKITKTVISLVPNRYFETTLFMLYSLNLQFSLLLRGMFMSAVTISLLASAGLWLIDIEYPLLVGIFAGIANLIPYVGPIVGTIAACVVAVMTSEPSSIFFQIVGVFLAVNLIDNVFVQPMIMARAANLHPLAVIFLVLAGSKYGGIAGMLVAVPLASLLQVIIKIIYTEIKRPINRPFSQYRMTGTFSSELMKHRSFS